MKAKNSLMGNLCPKYKQKQGLRIGLILTFLLTTLLAPAQQTNPLSIKGIVLSAENKQALEGATIKIKNTLLSTQSNKGGVFSIPTNQNKGILVISYLDYQTQEVPFTVLDPGTVIQISLKKADQQLEEVEVSTGYQNFKPERFVGAASKLDSTTFHNQAGKGIIDRLKANVTGVMFLKEASTSPTIRGVSTLYTTAMQPLIVVDNFPMDDRFDISSINPNDVLDISVLKDAAAASIWGSRAGNGVIVITTKKGKYNQALDISFSSNIAITEKPDLYAYSRIGISDFIELERFLFGKNYYNSALNNATSRPIVSPVVEILNQLKNNKIDETTAEAQIEALKKNDIRRDLDQYIYQKAVQQQHYLAMKGGSNNSNYSLSFGYNPSVSEIQKGKTDQQYTINGSHNIRPVKNLEFTSNLYFTKNRNPNTAIPIFSPFPYEALADENGNALPTSRMIRRSYLDTAGNGKLLDWQYRPLDEIKLSDNINHTKSLNLNLGASYRFFENLTGSVKYNYRTQNEFIKEHNSVDSYYARDLINRFSSIKAEEVTRVVPLGGILRLYDYETLGQQIRGQLDFNKAWNSHRLSAMVVGEASEAINNWHSNTFYGYDDEYETYASGLNHGTAYPTYGKIAGTTAKIASDERVSSGQISRRVSFLGNASYTYKNLYTIYSSARKDGANVFGATTNNKWKPLWSIGGNWNISNEEFFSSSWINALKIRSSFGYMGNTVNISGLTTIRYSATPVAITDLVYAVINNSPNPHLRWEEIKTVNVGVDFALFRNRLSGSLDFFNKASIDLIADMPTDPTTGIEKLQMNSASLNTKGTEINLNSINIQGAVSWNTGFGFSYVKPIVTKLAESKYAASDFLSYSINSSEGKIAYALSSYRWAGLDPLTGDPQGFLNGEISKDYLSIAGDSIQNQVFHGSSRPLIYGYLNNSISWKNLTLSANINYSFDYYFRKTTIQYSSLFGASRSGHPDYTERWQNSGDEMSTTIPSLTYPSDSNRDQFYAYSEVNVHRGDHIRLRDVRLQWNLNASSFSNLPIRSLQFFVSANNLNIILWRANKLDLDPDLSYSSEYSTYPASKIWTAGLNITF